MIERITKLKESTTSKEVKTLCESALNTLTSSIYKGVPEEARNEIELATISGLFESLSKIKDKEISYWVKNERRRYSIKNLGIRESINTLQGEARENLALRETLNSYRDFLNSGTPEVVLYEDFTTAMQSFSYFPKVGNAIKAIEDRVNTYKSDVSIQKIIETMKGTSSNYLLPLIEDLIQNYLDNKNIQTKSSLKEGLIKFSYDPFIRDIINLVSLDATELQLEYANASCDIQKVYSPIFYLGENEVAFNVKGDFYIKKGNNISRISGKNLQNLDPNFISLCEAVNHPSVSIERDHIKIYDKKHIAIIKEGKVLINDKEMSSEDFAQSFEMSEWTGDLQFLNLVEALRANFNEISEVDFVKRVYLKENENYFADIFKLRGNLFINTFDISEGKATFYRNVNPIQARGIMMEHLRYDVTSLFKDVISDEEKIIKEIEESRKEYSSYIKLLEEKIKRFRSESSPLSKEVIEILEGELLEVKNEYKDYLNLVEKYLRPLKEDITISVDVDGKKYIVPIPSEVVSNNSDTEEENEPASAITFDDDEAEYLSDSPSIPGSSVNLDSDEIEAEADTIEAEKEVDVEEPEGEIKIETGEEVESPEEAEEEEEEEEEEEAEEEKAEEESTDGTKEKKKKKIFLKKKRIE